MEKDSKKYEIGFLTTAEECKNEIINALKNHQAEIFNDGGVSQIKLAYPVKKETSAFFGYIQFSAAPDIIKNFKETLKLNSKILRFIIINSLVVGKVFSAKGGFSNQAEKQQIPLEKPEIKKVEIKKPKLYPQQVLSNEDLEKKLEEILK